MSGAPGREGDDDMYWTHRVVGCAGITNERRKRRSDCCKMQKFTTGKLHGGARELELLPSHQSYRTVARMSAIGTKRTSNRRATMSAFGGKADVSAFDPNRKSSRSAYCAA